MSLWSLHFYEDISIDLGCTNQLTLSRVSQSTLGHCDSSPSVSLLVWTTDNVNRFLEVSVSRQGRQSWRFVVSVTKDSNRTITSIVPRYSPKTYKVSLCPSPLGTIQTEITEDGMACCTFHCSYELTDSGMDFPVVVIGTVDARRCML